MFVQLHSLFRHAVRKGLPLPQGLVPSTLSGHPRVFWGCVSLHRLRRGPNLLLHQEGKHSLIRGTRKRLGCLNEEEDPLLAAR